MANDKKCVDYYVREKFLKDCWGISLRGIDTIREDNWKKLFNVFVRVGNNEHQVRSCSMFEEIRWKCHIHYLGIKTIF